MIVNITKKLKVKLNKEKNFYINYKHTNSTSSFFAILITICGLRTNLYLILINLRLYELYDI